MVRRSNYEKFPVILAGRAEDCNAGWQAIADRLCPHLRPQRVLCAECYPGVLVDEIQKELCTRLPTSTLFLAEECLQTPAELHAKLDPLLGTDRVFGQMSGLQLADYFDPSRLQQMRIAVARAALDGPVIVLGTGAWLVAPADATLLYADIARWEIQSRWRRGQIGNLGLKVTPSVANFLLIHFPEAKGRTAKDAEAFLTARGLVLRQVGAYKLPNALRMSVGTEEANRLVVAALREFLGRTA